MERIEWREWDKMGVNLMVGTVGYHDVVKAKYDVEMEIHADINTDPYFASNKALKEAMGYILGMGFVFKAKPDAFASSSCADKVV